MEKKVTLIFIRAKGINNSYSLIGQRFKESRMAEGKRFTSQFSKVTQVYTHKLGDYLDTFYVLYVFSIFSKYFVISTL